MENLAEFILGLLQVGTACIWPLTLLFILFLFRRQFVALLPRLLKAEVAGVKLEFGTAVEALKEAIQKGAPQLKDEPDKLVAFVLAQLEKLPEQEKPTPVTAAPLAGRAILWVDDNPEWTYYESNIFKRMGARVERASSTQEALAWLGRERFNLVISDVKRFEDGREDKLAGYELLTAIRARPAAPPVIFYMGNVAYLDQNRAVGAYGAADNPDQLLALVIRALGANS